MSYVFARAAAYYSPLAGGVVDFPIGSKLINVDGTWVSDCGTKALHDAEVMDRLILDGSLKDCQGEAAPDADLAEADLPEDADPASAESTPSADKPAARKPGQKPRKA